MSSESVAPHADSLRVLLLAPTPKDNQFCASVLNDMGIEVRLCTSLSEVCREAERGGAAAALVAEEFLNSDQDQLISNLLARQPAWSDFPVVVLLIAGEHPSTALDRLQELGNITLVRRPVRIAAFINTIRAKLRDRQRQYAVRDLLKERAESNQALEIQQRRFSLALKAGGMGAWEWQPGQLYWSEAMFELLGANKQETPTEQLFCSIVHPDDARAVRKIWTASVKKGQAFRHEFRIVRPDGKTHWAVAMGEPVDRETARAEHYAGLMWDITQRRRSERREKRTAEIEHFLSEATLRLTSSLDYETTLGSVTSLCVPTLADWAFLDLLSDDGSVRRVKVAHADPHDAELASRVARFPASVRIMEHPPARGLFANDSFFIPDFTEENLVAAAQNAEHEQVIRDVGPKSFVVVPLGARDQRFGALTLIRTDPKRRYKLADLRTAEELARRASTAIDNARLYEAGQQASLAKSEFVANMSHEIRTPMTAVLGYADLLAASEEDPEKLRHLRTIQRNGKFLLDVINDILDISKIEAGKMEFVRERFAVHELISDVHEMMHVRAMEKKLELKFEYASAIPEQIESDPKRLRQILVNLIGNAVKFTERGTIQLVVQYDASGGKPTMRFRVVDTGIGITHEQRSRLFQAFSQGDASVSRSFGGTGLGLALSNRLARMLGGSIDVASEPGRGSTFVCEISAGAVADLPMISPGGESRAIEQPRPDQQQQTLSCRVLVVDDRRDVRFLTKHFLVKFGAEVESVNDGIEAIETIAHAADADQRFDLILLDMQMPRLDGYQTAQRLREMGFSRPIIALTADAMHGDMSRCLESGCDAFLSKPIDAKELIEMVAHHTRSPV